MGDLGKRVEIDGLVHADKDEAVLEDTQVGGRMRVFNGGLALQYVLVLNLQHIIINSTKLTRKIFSDDGYIQNHMFSNGFKSLRIPLIRE